MMTNFYYCNPDPILRTTALTGTLQNPMTLLGAPVNYAITCTEK